MIPIFPECSVAILSLIVFLAGAPSDQLHGFRDDLTIAIVYNKQMDVI